MAAPTVLPIPRPKRNTARMSENVYTVAPKMSDKILVQTTSAARAVIPEIAIVTYTVQAAGAGTITTIRFSSAFPTVGAGVRLATSSPIAATVKLSAHAPSV